ncbi:hypothetical protein LEP1GSC145_1105 [Leptospira interrogans serovar Djasiman str. LT1649]|nr:hypothetical protein LEP1GSC077_2746 [Leptospira interrogans str. C10069]EMM90209.1 hypothetical protein LEP1GSC145_1105 [Leptospira interrogans serovar Djasiman str. LT1649]
MDITRAYIFVKLFINFKYRFYTFEPKFRTEFFHKKRWELL